MNDDDNRKLYRLGRRPGEQGPQTTTTGQIITNKTTVAITSNVEIGQQQWKITKDTLTVGTWNVQTLWTTGKLELLRNEMKRFRFDVIGISEVRWTGKGEIPSGDFIWSGEDTTHTRVVGMLLSAKAKKTLIEYNPISSRVITARFNATPFKLTVIHVYAPTSASSDDEIEIFYDSIEHALTQTPKKDIIIITGDWNAEIGSDNTHWESVMGRYGYGDRNERGDRLLEFAALQIYIFAIHDFSRKQIENGHGHHQMACTRV
ncbi:unnamed protein product [Rotaria magnacalcarata]|uniref:Endonuclease/exonuclease/phosphatase domain-containing protein n=1 Tax=Rotaria magnacalcarata TaxID=392030 RepID=A0A816RPN6_9BILA|nr:unnamed protein product [Rotaria magnacalcarata]